MSESYSEARAVRIMVGELRSQGVPELRWDALEQRLFSRIDADRVKHSPKLAARPQRSAALGAFPLAATAAAICLAIGSGFASQEHRNSNGSPPHHVDTASLALAGGQLGKSGAHELLSLRSGDVIETEQAPTVFAHANLTTWTLAPDSRVTVLGMGREGVGHTLGLERGSLRAEVTPRDPSEGLVEAFIVEVDGTRIAVHGTAFSVTREGASVTIDVEHGVVAVGAVGHVGTTTGHVLVGPARASFSLDGGRSARLLPVASPTQVVQVPLAAAEPPRPPAEGPPAEADAVVRPLLPAAVPPHASKPAAEAPTAQEAQPAIARTLTVDSVRATLGACFQKRTDASSSTVRVSVSSTLRLEISEDGTVRAARFDPPLKPDLQVCANPVYHGRFGGGARQIEIPVTFGM